MSDFEAQQAEVISRLRERLKRLRSKSDKANRQALALGFLNGVVATLRPGDLAIDCGANVGKITTLLATSGADVVAFEPDPWAFARLTEATEHLPNVMRINAAVGVDAGELALYRSERFAENPEKMSESSSLMKDARSIDAEGEVISVEVIDFPAWLEGKIASGRHIGVVKMDIEGAELELMEVLLDRRLPERTGPFLVETHAGLFPAKRERFRLLSERAATYPAKRVNLDWI